MADTIDLRPEVVNVKLYEGDAWAVQVELTQPGVTTPLDLTGATITATVKPKDGSADFPLTINPGDLTQGEFYYGQSAATIPGKYDVQVSFVGEARTYIKGSLSVEPDISPE